MVRNEVLRTPASLSCARSEEQDSLEHLVLAHRLNLGLLRDNSSSAWVLSSLLSSGIPSFDEELPCRWKKKFSPRKFATTLFLELFCRLLFLVTCFSKLLNSFKSSHQILLCNPEGFAVAGLFRGWKQVVSRCQSLPPLVLVRRFPLEKVPNAALVACS